MNAHINYSKDYFDEICDVMSKDRLLRYTAFTESGLAHLGIVFVPYMAIQEASSRLLPVIQLVEICLRNRIDAAICKYYANHPNGNDPNTWYDWLLTVSRTCVAIKDAKERAKRDTRRKQPTHGDVISHITFGTWISIINEIKKLGKEPWREICNSIFRRSRETKLPSANAMIAELARMNNLRNRLFHYEPIWSGKNAKTLDDAERNLCQINADVLKCISWLSPCMHNLITDGGMKYDKVFSANITHLFRQCRIMSELTKPGVTNELLDLFIKNIEK